MKKTSSSVKNWLNAKFHKIENRQFNLPSLTVPSKAFTPRQLMDMSDGQPKMMTQWEREPIYDDGRSIATMEVDKMDLADQQVLFERLEMSIDKAKFELDKKRQKAALDAKNAEYEAYKAKWEQEQRRELTADDLREHINSTFGQDTKKGGKK